MVQGGGEVGRVARQLRVGRGGKTQARASTAADRGEHPVPGMAVEGVAGGAHGEGVQRAAFARVEIRRRHPHGGFVQPVDEAGVVALQRAGVPVQAVAGAVAELRHQHHFDRKPTRTRADAGGGESCNGIGMATHGHGSCVQRGLGVRGEELFRARARASRLSGPAEGQTSKAKPVSVLTRLSGTRR